MGVLEDYIKSGYDSAVLEAARELAEEEKIPNPADYGWPTDAPDYASIPLPEEPCASPRPAYGRDVPLPEPPPARREAAPPTEEDMKSLRPVGAGELAKREFEPLSEPVKGLVVEGLTLLCGASKIGKSWLVLQMCCAVAKGAPFLERATEQGDVLYLAYEDSERRLRYRLDRLGEAPVALSFDTHVIPLEGGLIEAMEAWTRARPAAKLIVIDTLQKARGRSSSRANAYAEDYAVMGKLKAFADQHHVAVVLVHHLNKLRDADDPFDKISGSTGLMGAADTAILLDRRRGEDDATVTFAGRDVWGDDIALRFDDCRWKVCSKESAERERYEGMPIVQAVKWFMREETLDGKHYVTLEDLKAWGMAQGLSIGTSAREVKKNLESADPLIRKYDHILIDYDKRVGDRRCLMLTKLQVA